jgi:uncharacterized membrane protein
VKQLRILLALAGFVAAALGVALDDHRIGWLAIALLAASLLLRLIKQKTPTSNHDEHPL